MNVLFSEVSGFLFCEWFPKKKNSNVMGNYKVTLNFGNNFAISGKLKFYVPVYLSIKRFAMNVRF